MLQHDDVENHLLRLLYFQMFLHKAIQCVEGIPDLLFIVLGFLFLGWQQWLYYMYQVRYTTCRYTMTFLRTPLAIWSPDPCPLDIAQ